MVGDRIFIGNPSQAALRQIRYELSAFLKEPQTIAKIVQFLGENKGRLVGEIFGYNVGGSGTLDVDIMFGRLYMPEVPGCRATLKVDRSTTATADIKISMRGVVGGSGLTLWCKMSQSGDIVAAPKDLKIPVTLRYVKWQRKPWETFFTYDIQSFGEWIIFSAASNPWGGSAGYDFIKRTHRGRLGEVRAATSVENTTYTTEIAEKAIFSLGAQLSVVEGLPAVNLKGSVEFLAKVTSFYALDPSHDYLMLPGKEFPIEHYWAWRKPIRGS